MSTPQELEQKFWEALAADMIMMLGAEGVEDGHVRPMTAQLEGSKGPIWFFTSTDSALVRALKPDSRAVATFTSKSLELFASVKGGLRIDHDRDAIGRLWNKFVAAWYPGGMDDPKLVLLRLDAEQAEIWENASDLFAGIKLLFGGDPKVDYKNKVATVELKRT